MVRRLEFLDGVRAVLAFIVVFEHLAKAFYPTLFIREIFVSPGTELTLVSVIFSPLSLIYNGALAVSIFFVLSGYVLTYRLTQMNQIVFKSYIRMVIRRVVRFLGPVSCIVVAIHALQYFGAFSGKNYWTEASTFHQLPTFQSANLLQEIGNVMFFSESTLNPVFWTLGLELISSIILITAFWIHKTHMSVFSRVYGAIVLLVGSICLVQVTHVVILGVWFGSTLFFISKHCQRLFNLLIVKAILLIASLLLILDPMKGGDSNPFSISGMYTHYNELMYIQYVLAGSLFLLVLSHSWLLMRVFSYEPLVKMGKLSFGLYLVHYPVITVVGPLLWTGTTVNGYERFLLTATIVFVLAFSISRWLNVHIEKPLSTLFNTRPETSSKRHTLERSKTQSTVMATNK